VTWALVQLELAQQVRQQRERPVLQQQVQVQQLLEQQQLVQVVESEQQQLMRQRPQ
jgi:hypothetical protein